MKGMPPGPNGPSKMLALMRKSNQASPLLRLLHFDIDQRIDKDFLHELVTFLVERVGGFTLVGLLVLLRPSNDRVGLLDDFLDPNVILFLVLFQAE